MRFSAQTEPADKKAGGGYSMQARERTTLTGQMLPDTSCGPATVWRCAVGLAVVIVIALQGTYQPMRDAPLTAALDDARAAASRKELLDEARAAAHRKELFDARRVHFQRVGASPVNRSA